MKMTSSPLAFGPLLLRVMRQFTRKKDTKFFATKSSQANHKENPMEKIGSVMHTVSNFDKRLLVWVKRYPSVSAVPKQVTMDCILQARTKGRIRVCNIIIMLSVVGFIYAVYSGKKESAAGNTLTKASLEWYAQLQEEKMREMEAGTDKR